MALPTEAEQLRIVRERCGTITRAVLQYLDDGNRNALLAALQEDWRTAVLCDNDMTETQRTHWWDAGEAEVVVGLRAVELDDEGGA